MVISFKCNLRSCQIEDKFQVEAQYAMYCIMVTCTADRDQLQTAASYAAH